MAGLNQQNLPRIQIPFFDGSLLYMSDFVIKIKDFVHNQGYLNSTERLH